MPGTVEWIANDNEFKNLTGPFEYFADIKPKFVKKETLRQQMEVLKTRPLRVMNTNIDSLGCPLTKNSILVLTVDTEPNNKFIHHSTQTLFAQVVEFSGENFTI